MSNFNGPLKVGIGGPVGAGKTSLTEALCKALSKKLDIKFLPRLHFVEDKSFDYAERIEKLIKENKNK